MEVKREQEFSVELPINLFRVNRTVSWEEVSAALATLVKGGLRIEDLQRAFGTSMAAWDQEKRQAIVGLADAFLQGGVSRETFGDYASLVWDAFDQTPCPWDDDFSLGDMMR